MTFRTKLSITAFAYISLVSSTAHAASHVNFERPKSSDAILASASQASESDAAIRQLDTEPQGSPLWSASSRQALERALASRNRHGLDHFIFVDPEVGAMGGAASEAAYTKAAINYADALAFGIAKPAALHDTYTIEHSRPDLSTALVQAVRTNNLESWLSSLAPQDQGYSLLADAYRQAQQSSASAFQTIEMDGAIEVGDDDPRISEIEAQLVDGEYLVGLAPEGEAAGTIYTQRIADAIKALQRDFGIATDGIIGPDTLAVLNLRPNDRERSLAVALERRRWLSRTAPGTRIDVNTAAARLSYYRNGILVDERRVIVGKPGNETPPLGSPIYRLVANPTWTVPKSIQHGEMANVSRAYLRAHNMRIRGGWIVQQPGPQNALGLVKFDMRNNQAIYLHDTSAPSLFDRSERHLSHGCVRVADALGFAEMLAEQEGLGDKWRAAQQSGNYTMVDLPREIPVRLLYENIFINSSNKITYRTDPYGWNPAVAKALGFGDTTAKRVKSEPIDVGP